ncbi:MAG: hypothetical protein ACREQW_24095 [Candidatus Binatia bacterium]
MEEALRNYQGGKVLSQDRFQIPMVEPNRQLRLVTATLPGAGEIIRVNPQYRGAPDTHVNLLFDEKSGDLLTVVSGGELNVWRTGAPAGIAARYLATKGREASRAFGQQPPGQRATDFHFKGHTLSGGSGFQSNRRAPQKFRGTDEFLAWNQT